MELRIFSFALLAAGTIGILATTTAFAKKKTSDNGSVNSVRANCLKQVGAYYHPSERRWYYSATGRGSPQEQAFYACLDSKMSGKR